MMQLDFDIDLSVSGVPVPVDVRGDDKLHYRFVSTGASAPSTAVLALFSRRVPGEPGNNESNLTIDGTTGTIDISTFAEIEFNTTTTEAAKRGNLYIFTRKDQE